MEEVRNDSKPIFVLLDDRILIFESRLCVLNDRELRKEILEEIHCSKLVIHSGGMKM